MSKTKKILRWADIYCFGLGVFIAWGICCLLVIMSTESHDVQVVYQNIIEQYASFDDIETDYNPEHRVFVMVKASYPSSKEVTFRRGNDRRTEKTYYIKNDLTYVKK